jgi:hypothetical protein
MRILADERSAAARSGTVAPPVAFAVAGLLVLAGFGQGAAVAGEPADATAAPAAAEAGIRPAAAQVARPGIATDRRRQPRSDDAERDRLLRLIILYGSGARPFGFFK